MNKTVIKCKRGNCNSKRVVYLACCTACRAYYIGKTERCIKKRIYEHYYKISKHDTTNALYRHVSEKGDNHVFIFAVIDQIYRLEGKYREVILHVKYRLKGRTRRVCLSNGWDNGNPTCVPVMCPKPEVKDGHVVYENGLENRFNTSVTFKCNEGFTLTGSLAVACNKDGRWDPPLPTCEGGHNKSVEEYRARLLYHVRTMPTSTEGIHNKTGGEYPTRLSDGVSTSDVPLGNTEGSRNEEASGHFLRFAGEDSINDSTRMLWYLLPIPAFLFCVGGVMFIIYMKKCRGSYSTNECKESPQSQRSSISANGVSITYYYCF
ncbi:uncharacterized protein LOC122806053 [Protopterus annectens]|uniref:uncharacterized protein LOC122806053 n=1 Tax=Protopterus annectens TaxID=7888 RepID=UPI001CFBD658|nr:uncharacterized protein LOC122806053 [Protopterus annectens]